MANSDGKTSKLYCCEGRTPKSTPMCGKTVFKVKGASNQQLQSNLFCRAKSAPTSFWLSWAVRSVYGKKQTLSHDLDKCDWREMSILAGHLMLHGRFKDELEFVSAIAKN
ncbi:hypothetical protein ACFE04_008299 [Oxalis oulophora]